MNYMFKIYRRMQFNGENAFISRKFAVTYLTFNYNITFQISNDPNVQCLVIFYCVEDCNDSVLAFVFELM